MSQTTITLPEAITICQAFEKKLAPLGYHCGLTGSVLYNGSSTKDLDVVVYPHNVGKLQDHEMLSRLLSESTNEPYEVSASCNDKAVFVIRYNKIRIDLFFLK